ncbi:Alpha/beta hydrolase fold protein [Naematelia encephala]|uniref:Alpha/beta hydrolase fold protein n=1 Tax=Naematelia encephala TaxID=71784 RepID=A0A1Y2AM98_9TREE|nr:Alpha/beta hydrolase fold protein [Naematelia encephala]
MTEFTGFKETWTPIESNTTSDVKIYAKIGGSGPPLLLVHGYPQTHYIWRSVAGRLAEHFTVFAADLRGYGQSSKPRGSESHVEYSKREMACDMVNLMAEHGFESFNILAHDRGARVAHRLALDQPHKVKRMILLDIAPTLWMYDHSNMTFAMGYWHWFFLPQPSPFPEDLILSDPKRYWAMLSSRKSHENVIWTDEVVEQYQKYYFTPEGVHGACEDYRASTTIDLEHDRQDLQAGNKLNITQLKVFWGRRGMINNFGDVLDIWKGYCNDTVALSGKALDCGHYIAEEQPEELLKEALEFFSAS